MQLLYFEEIFCRNETAAVGCKNVSTFLCLNALANGTYIYIYHDLLQLCIERCYLCAREH